MTTYTTIVPLLAVLVSLAAVPLILLSDRKPNLREFWTIAAGVVKFALVISLVPQVAAGNQPTFSLLDISPGLELALRVDPLGLVFGLIASGLWIFTSFYTIGYMRGNNEKKQTRFFASFAVCLSATIGIAFSANLLTFLIFFEILTIATYPLVIHKESKEAIAGGRKYLVYTLTAGNLLIAATAWTYSLAGGLDFVPGGLLTGVTMSPTSAAILFLLFLGGVGVKAGIMPIHSWLPTAMVAPTPVSALLHAVAVVKSGVFGVIRVVGFIFGPQTMANFGLNEILIVVAGTTILLASLLALSHTNLKRRLAYSTVSQLSYIVLGAALLTPAGFTGSVFHIVSHATLKITLFFCAGAIYVHMHKEDIRELNGIGTQMPWTMGAFTVAAMGLAGVPPLDGFLSKFYLGLGTLEGGHTAALIVLLTSGVLNIAYFFPIIYRAFFRPYEGKKEYGEATPFMVVPLVSTATLSLLFGIYPNLFFGFYDLAVTVSRSIMGI